jgi:hypothetical protein
MSPLPCSDSVKRLPLQGAVGLSSSNIAPDVALYHAWHTRPNSLAGANRDDTDKGKDFITPITYETQ